MTYERLAYDDADTTVKMHSDCDACASQMGFARPQILPEALGEAPSIAYEDFPREIRKPEITVDEATALLAAQLHLHLD
jgi:hypothetical protein